MNPMNNYLDDRIPACDGGDRCDLLNENRLMEHNIRHEYERTDGFGGRREQTGCCPKKYEQDRSCFPALAMVYSPYQQFDGLIQKEEALMKGTLFECLDLPFVAGSKGGCDKC